MTNTLQSPNDLARKLKLLEDILKLIFPEHLTIQSIVLEKQGDKFHALNEASFGIEGFYNGVHQIQKRFAIHWDNKLNFYLFEVISQQRRVSFHPASTTWRRVYKLISDRHLDAENLKN